MKKKFFFKKRKVMAYEMTSVVPSSPSFISEHQPSSLPTCSPRTAGVH